MSDLLRRWLREEIGVISKTDHFEEDFASGFVFGELFHKCNLQPDFHLFVDRVHPDAMINNFTRLQPSVTKLGLPFDSRFANRIMTEEKGVASKFLYQIKTTLDSLRKDMYDSKLTGSFARTLTVATVPTTLAVESQRTRTQKAVYDAKTHKQFEDNMRVRAQPPNKLYETMHLQRFAEHQMEHEERTTHNEIYDYTMTMERRDNYRTGRLDLMRAQRHEKLEYETETASAHQASMTHARRLEKKELRIELALHEKKARARCARTAAASDDAFEGIDSFEKNLKRLGCDEGGEDYTGGELPPVGPTPLDHLVRIKDKLPPPINMAQEGAEYLGRLKVKKGEDVAARKERERRRRKVLLEQQKNQEEGEQKRREESLLSTLARQSKEEQRVAHRLWQLKQEKEVMRENRAYREEQYRSRREKDYEEALQREKELSDALKAQFNEAAAAETARWRETEAAHAEEKKQKRHKMCSEVSRELLSLAVRCAEYRERNDTLVPRKEYREWVSLFVKGMPLDPSLLQDVAPTPEPDDAAEALNQATVEDYLQSRGEWETAEAIGFNVAEGVIQEEILKLTIAAPVPPVLPDLSFPIKLAVVSSLPFTGKTTAAQQLAEAHVLALIDPELVVAAAIDTANVSDSRPTADGEQVQALPPTSEDEPLPLPSHAQQTQLGMCRRARDALQNGTEVPDEVIVALIVAAIARLAEEGVEKDGAEKVEEVKPKGKEGGKAKTPPKPAETKGAKSGTAKGGSVTEGSKPVGVPAILTGPRGFVLDGFPRTAAQAALLEKAFTGLDLEYRASVKAKASFICPPPHDPTEDLPLVSGLDKVLILNVSGGEEIALRRALGRRVDPEDGRIYHMEFDPPPEKVAGLMERLQENLGPYNDAALAQVRLAAAVEEAPPLLQWMTRFDNLLTPISAEGGPADVFAIAKVVADRVLDAKQKALETKLASQAAAQAAAQAEQARDAAVAAKKDTEGAAAMLLGWKKAEVEADKQLKGGDEDRVARQMLSTKTAEEIAVCLLSAKQAMQDAEEAAKRAEQQDKDAQAALALAQDKVTQTDAAVEAKASAEWAAKQASISRKAAADAATAAKEAAEEAAAVLAKAEKTAGMTEEELFPPPLPLEPEVPVEESSEEIVLVVPPFVSLTQDFASILYGQWSLLEKTYLKGLRKTFFNLREERRAALGHFAGVKKDFLGHLRRPDTKQQMVTQFQVEYNAVDLDMRRLPEVQGELLLRTEELRDALWDVCDAKREENQTELERIMGDSWVTDRSSLLVKHFTSLVQLEADSFAATHGQLHDYYRAKCAFEIQARPLDAKAFGGVQLADVGDWGTPMVVKERKHVEAEEEVAAPAAAAAKGKPGKDAAKRPVTPTGKGGPKDLKGGKAGGAEQEEMPEWLAPLEEAAPKLLQAIQTAMALVPITEGEVEVVDPKDKAGKAGKAPAEPTEEEKEVEMSSKIAALALKDSGVLARDVAMFTARLQRLATRAAVYLAELAEASETTRVRLDEWMSTRYQAECSAVAAVVTVVREAAHAQVELNHDLTFQGEDLLEDISTLTAEPFVPPPPPATPEATPAAGVLTCKQLELVATHFQAVAPTGLMMVEDAASLLSRVGMEEGGRGLPQLWAAAPLPRIRECLKVFDPHGTGYLEWRELLSAFVAQSFPTVVNAKLLQLGEALKALDTADKDKDGFLTLEELLEAKMWFQLSYRSGFNRFEALKRILFTALSEPLEATGDRRLGCMTLMLHLCASETLEGGMDKAFHVVARAGGHLPGSTVTWDQLERAAYPYGRDTHLDVGRAQPSTNTNAYRYTGIDIEELIEHTLTASGEEVKGRALALTSIQQRVAGVTVEEDDIAAAEHREEPAVSVKQLLNYPDATEFAEQRMQRYLLKKLVI